VFSFLNGINSMADAYGTSMFGWLTVFVIAAIAVISPLIVVAVFRARFFFVASHTRALAFTISYGVSVYLSIQAATYFPINTDIVPVASLHVMAIASFVHGVSSISYFYLMKLTLMERYDPNITPITAKTHGRASYQQMSKDKVHEHHEPLIGTMPTTSITHTDASHLEYLEQSLTGPVTVPTITIVTATQSIDLGAMPESESTRRRGRRASLAPVDQLIVK